jgi:hypothetical protein
MQIYEDLFKKPSTILNALYLLPSLTAKFAKPAKENIVNRKSKII